ncbi:MAG: Ldh family oxidoreductase [Desulfobacterales bacterium]|nr:Ldh family oxidoreductase [Desulfobacterales bacterium]
MGDNRVFAIEALRQFIVQAFAAADVPAAEGKMVADNLIHADLWGIGTHGVSRFPIYLKRIQAGAVNPRPEIRIDNSYPAVLSVDGDNGLGAVVTVKALDAAIAAADKFGLCAAGIKGSNHFGAAGYYCDMGARADFITIVLTDAPPAIPPWGGKEPYFGTNPIAVGLPRKGKPPVVLDLATSIVARGKIIEAAGRGENIPEGWALNKEGTPTTNSREALAGTLLPMAGPKGYALALAVEHLAGVLTGAAFGRDVAWQYGDKQSPANVGHIIIVLKADAFIGLDDYHERNERFFREIKACEKAAGISEIYLPGERERILAQTLTKSGIEVPGGLVKEFETIARQYGLSLAGA